MLIAKLYWHGVSNNKVSKNKQKACYWYQMAVKADPCVDKTILKKIDRCK